MDQSTPRPIRVVQWATGNIGSRSLRAVIEHPELELAGVYVTSPDKVGRDAGELAGTGTTTGVRATGDADALLALDADVALYMPLLCDYDDVCRLLAAGLDVVTTRGEFHHPASLDPAVRARVEQACAAGGSSIHSTGSSPGFITEAIPLVLTSIVRRLDHLTIDEYADLSRRDSPALLFDIMGFGKSAEELGSARAAHLAQSFGPSLRVTAEALGLPLDSIEATGELALATRDVEIAAGTLRAGTVAGQRTTVSGMRNGVELITFRANWVCTTTDLDADWDLQATGWRVQVAGDTPLDVRLEFAVPLERMAEYSPGYTAHRAVNAVAAVHAAAPGIRTSVELPQVVASLGAAAISEAEAAELAGLVAAGGQDPNFLPVEAERIAAEHAPHSAAADAEEVEGLVGTPSHDPNFLPVEAGRVTGEDDAGDTRR